MKIMSTTGIISTFLLTSVSMSFAADAVVVAEPEPAEYVRVCDAYGVGFFYIPGTENCLRISGYAQYDIGVGDLVGRVSWDKKNGQPDRNDTYFKRARAGLMVDARSETELGTLRGYTELWFDYRSTGSANVVSTSNTENYYELKHAYAELGGLKVGYSSSLFKSFTLFAGKVIQDELVPVGPSATGQVSYTFKGGNGFAALIGLEQGNGLTHTIDSYVPHIVAGASLKQKWGGIYGVVGYDSNYQEIAGKLRVELQATDRVSLWAMAGYGTDDNIANSVYKPWGGNWAVWGGGSAKLSPKLAANLALAYDENENFAAVANLVYDVVPGFYIQPEITYRDNFDTSNADAVGGWVRFRRSF